MTDEQLEYRHKRWWKRIRRHIRKECGKHNRYHADTLIGTFTQFHFTYSWKELIRDWCKTPLHPAEPEQLKRFKGHVLKVQQRKRNYSEWVT